MRVNTQYCKAQGRTVVHGEFGHALQYGHAAVPIVPHLPQSVQDAACRHLSEDKHNNVQNKSNSSQFQTIHVCTNTIDRQYIFKLVKLSVQTP
jgi:hypothetical protein